MPSAIATVTSKGRITLPKLVRDRLGLQAGDQVAFLVDETHGVAVLKLLSRRVADVYGLLGEYAPERPVSVEAMRIGVAAVMRRRRP